MRRVLFAAILLFAAASLADTDQSHWLQNGEQKDTQPWLGMSVRRHTDSQARQYLHVERVTQDGPSDRAGIRPGDIVRAVGGISIQHMDDLDFLMFLSEQKPGERLVVRITREGRMQNIVVVVGVLPETAREAWKRAFANARRARIASQAKGQ